MGFLGVQWTSSPFLLLKGTLRLQLRDLGPSLILQAALLLTLLPGPSVQRYTGHFVVSTRESTNTTTRHHRSITSPVAGPWEWTNQFSGRRRSTSWGGKNPDPLTSPGRPPCLYQRFHRNAHLGAFQTNNYNDSSANSSKQHQQLSKLQRVSNWINRLCSYPDPRGRLERLLSKSPCSEFKLDICQALRPSEVKNIIGSDHFACFKTVENVWRTFHHIKNTLDDFNLFMPSFDSSPYSVEFELDQCKIAYGFWICSESLPLYLTSTINNETIPVAPCRSVCRDVEKRCPFLIRGSEEDKAAGNPTFLCRDENVPSVIFEGSSAGSGCCYEQIKDPPPGSWRSIKKSSFLDPTQSCLSLLGKVEEGYLPGGPWESKPSAGGGEGGHSSMHSSSSSSSTAQELTACDSFYYVPSNLNVSESPEHQDIQTWMTRSHGEDEPGFPLVALSYQFNLEEFFLSIIQSTLLDATHSGSSSSLPSPWIPHYILPLILIRTLWNYFYYYNYYYVIDLTS